MFKMLQSCLHDLCLFMHLCVCTQCTFLSLTDPTEHKFQQVLNIFFLLQLEQCARLTDVAIGIVTALCPRLTHLNISSCDRLTNESLHHIQRNCKRLRYLDISFCCGISPQAVEQFEGKMTLPTLLKRNVGISGNGANGTFGLKGVRSGGNLTQVL